MRTIKIIIWALLIITFFIACSQDDENTNPEPTVVTDNYAEDLNNITAVIQELTTGSEQVWKIESAEIINTGMDISDLYNIQDDEFRFSVGSEATELNLRWKRGFNVASGENSDEVKSNINLSSLNFAIEVSLAENITNISSEDNRIIGNYNASLQKIFGLIYYKEGDNPISVVLVKKLASNYVTAASTLTNPQEIFQWNTGIFRVGFKISQADNSLFITNRNDLEMFGQLAYKVDLTTNTTTGLTFIQQDFATKNIEFINDEIISVGGTKFEVFDYNFTAVQSTQDLMDNAVISNGSASLNNEVYLFGGIVNGSATQLSTWSLDQSTYTNVTTLPFELSDTDGEIVDQKLYMFGGWTSSDSQDQGSNSVYIYDLDTHLFSQLTIPVFLRETYTSVVEHLIYVGGLRTEDVDGNGNFETVPYFGVFNTVSSTFEQVDLNVGDLLDSRRLVHLQVAGDKAYFITSETLGAPDGFTNRLYSVDLN